MTVEELSLRLKTICPEVHLVKDRPLRQILSRLFEQGESVPASVEVPIWVNYSTLDDLGILPHQLERTPTQQVLLLHSPEEWLDHRLNPDQVLRYYWRLLFRGKVEKLLRQELWFPALLPDAELREARFVLVQDGYLSEFASEEQFLACLGAAWLELSLFEPEQVSWFFPGLSPYATRLRESLEHLLNIPVYLEETRPEGAAERRERLHQDWHAEQTVAEPTSTEQPVEHDSRLARESQQARLRGNWVRVAIVEQSRYFSSDHSAIHIQAARSALEQGLLDRLAPLLLWEESRKQRWAEALVQLLEPASRGFWPQAARCLYDLQKIVSDLQGEISVVDPIQWLRTFGKRSVVRTLTNARLVILLGHLRTAEKHLLRAQLSPELREQLERLFQEELSNCEARLREELQPLLRQVLEQSGLSATTPIEVVAQNKVIDELLDLICSKGYLRLSDLRDAVARNQLKLKNLQNLGEWMFGDALLRADLLLADALDGVYHRGEAYLRGLQRGSSITFGTPVGRWLSKYVALPFGGAFMAMEFGKYLSYEVTKLSQFVLRQFGLGAVTKEDLLGTIAGSAVWAHSSSSVLEVSPFAWNSIAIVFFLGIWFSLLIHVPRFRAWTLRGLSGVWRVLRLGLVELPKWLWRSRPIRFLRHNPVSRAFKRYCGTASWITFLFAVALTLNPGDPEMTAWICAAVFSSVTLFCATPTGRIWEDSLVDWLAALWRDLSVNLVQGVLRWVLWLFQLLSNFLERWLYTVDEWLRFREGQSRGTLWVKGFLAVLWFPIAYLFRFSFYLLVEPQVNPVKHFPVVTVGHKLILPLTPELGALIGSNWTAGAIVSGIPGIFGFIAWELKENWRLYSENRTEQLPRLALGHHGETMRGLLRPGFHSGTVPNLYDKLRRMLRKADRVGYPQPVGKALHGLHEIEHALKLFAEREWLATLRLSHSLRQVPFHIHHVTVNVQSVAIELSRADFPGVFFRIAFEHRDQEIVAHISNRELLDTLDADQREALEFSVAGLCQMACAEPVRSATSVPAPSWSSWQNFWLEQSLRNSSAISSNR